jgi:hypothetical protein
MTAAERGSMAGLTSSILTARAHPNGKVWRSGSVVATAKLEGLQIFQSRGKWYVCRRVTGDALVKGFVGDREALNRELAKPEFLQIYNKPRLPKRTAMDFADGTLGRLVHWFSNGDIDRHPKDLDPAGSIEGGFPKWRKLSTATRDEYLKAFCWLHDVFDEPLGGFTTPELYELRDKCAHKKKTRFADKMISALSSMFSSAVERGKMGGNPCLGMRKGHDTDPNANREWHPSEFAAAFAAAPVEFKTLLVLARFGGLRGQSLVEVGWRQYMPHATTGMAVQLVTRKNHEPTFIPALEDAGLPREPHPHVDSHCRARRRHALGARKADAGAREPMAA